MIAVNYVDNTLSLVEKNSIYLQLEEKQKREFSEFLQDSIERFIDERKQLRDSLSLQANDVIFKELFNELYNLSVRCISNYFGVRRV